MLEQRIEQIEALKVRMLIELLPLNWGFYTPVKGYLLLKSIKRAATTSIIKNLNSYG